MIDAAALKLVTAPALDTEQRMITLGAGVCLRAGRVHEVMGAAAHVFAALAAARHGQDIVWIGLRRDLQTLCPTGLERFLDPDKVVLVEGVGRDELLWAADTALRAAGRCGVIIELPTSLSLHESRRLQLAAEAGGSLGLVLLQGPATTSAAQTRWQCTPLLAPGPAWHWQCVKGKNGESGAWRADWCGEQNATHPVHLAAAAPA